MDEAEHPDADTDAAPTRPLIDVTPALHIAGHEEELMGTVGVPDTGPVLRHPGEPDEHEEAEQRIRDAVVTRGISPID